MAGASQAGAEADSWAGGSPCNLTACNLSTAAEGTAAAGSTAASCRTAARGTCWGSSLPRERRRSRPAALARGAPCTAAAGGAAGGSTIVSKLLSFDAVNSSTAGEFRNTGHQQTVPYKLRKKTHTHSISEKLSHVVNVKHCLIRCLLVPN